MEGDEAFYYFHDGIELKGLVLTHVDNFTIAEKAEFVEKIIQKVEAELTVSKIERGSFRFTGVDVKKINNGIEVSMNDYAESISKIEEFRKGKKDDKLLSSELKLFRGYTGKIGWLAENVRPDLCFTSLVMSKKGSNATLADLKKVNHTINKVKETESRMLFTNADMKEVIGVGDASYKWDDKPVGGNFILISNKKTNKVVPVFWKSNQIARAVHSSKDAETLNLAKLVDDTVYLSRQLELLLLGKYEKKIPVKLFTDSEPTLESVASTKPIETKRLRNQVQELKEVLLTKEVDSFAWLSTKDMIADALTKEMKKNKDLENLMIKNIFHLSDSTTNQVKAIGDELRMLNIKNRKSTVEDSLDVEGSKEDEMEVVGSPEVKKKDEEKAGE